MIANVFLYIIIILIILIFIFIFVFLFKISNKVKDNYKYLKDKYQELYDKIQSIGSIPGINIDKILEQINNNIENISKLKENIDQINNDLNNTDKKIKELEKTNQETVQNITTINKKLEENSKDNENIKNQIKDQNKNIDQINAEIIKINSNYDEYLKYKDNIDKEINTLNQHYNEYISDKKILEDSINKRFDEVYKTIDNIKGNYDDTEIRKLINNNTKSIEDLNNTTLQKLNEMDEKITSINTRLENIEKSITSINTDIKNLQSNISDINKNIESINNDIKSITTKIDNLKTNTETSIKSINTDIATIQDNIKKMDDDITSIKSSIKTLEQNISNIQNDIKSIKNNIFTINTTIMGMQREMQKNYFFYENIVFVYNYNSKITGVYTNPKDQMINIIDPFIPTSKYAEIMYFQNVNFVKKTFDILHLYGDYKIFLLLKNIGNSNYDIYDVLIIKNNYLNYIDYIIDEITEEKVSIIKINFKNIKNNSPYFNFFAQYNFIFSNKFNSINDFPLTVEKIKSNFNDNSSKLFKINLLFFVSDMSENDKNVFFSKLYPNNLNSIGYKAFSNFNKTTLNKFCYIGDNEILNNNLLNDYQISNKIDTQVVSLVLLNKILYNISYT